MWGFVLYLHSQTKEMNMNLASLGLTVGQTRQHNFLSNADWYNKNGEKIGHGDLSAEDFFRITKAIPEGEVFAATAVDPKPEPTRENFFKWVRYVVMGGKMYHVSPFGNNKNVTCYNKERDTQDWGNGFEFKMLTQDEFRKLFTGS